MAAGSGLVWVVLIFRSLAAILKLTICHFFGEKLAD